MVNIKYNQKLLEDFDLLIQDFVVFMNLNLIHSDANLSGDCKTKMSELISYSVKQSKPFNPFFEYPLLNYQKANKLKLEKNILNVIKFFYTYLTYCEPILKTCKPEIYSDRFAEIKKHYSSFSKEYLN